MSDKDIVTDLLECAADSRATEGDYYADQFATAPEIFERAAAEIARLRLTDEEREAIKWAAVVSEGLCQMGAMNRARILLGILERLG